MTTPSRERTARRLLTHQPPVGSSAAKRLMYEKQREDGWNNHVADPLPRLPASSKAPAPRPPPKERLFSEYPPPRARKSLPRKSPPTLRLQPLSPRVPATPPDAGDVLRLKAIAAIEYRDNIIQQLHTLLADVPESPSRRRGPKKAAGLSTSQRDTILGVLREMTMELQMAGIRVVEAIVAWMLCVGKSAPTPPVFRWHDANYLVRMHGDLDFLGDALAERGLGAAVGGKSTTGNPLLIEPNQRLGRVWAAHAIVAEMVELASPSKTSRPPDALELLPDNQATSPPKEAACARQDADGCLPDEGETDGWTAGEGQVDAKINDGVVDGNRCPRDHDGAAASIGVDESPRGSNEEEREHGAAEPVGDLESSERKSAMAWSDGVEMTGADIAKNAPSGEAKDREDDDDQSYGDDDFDAHESSADGNADLEPGDARTTQAPTNDTATDGDDTALQWRAAWLEAGLPLATVDAVAAVCCGTTDASFLADAETRAVLPVLATAVATTLPPGDRASIVAFLVRLVDEATTPVVARLQSLLERVMSPDDVDDVLDALREATDRLWADEDAVHIALLLLQQLHAAQMPLPSSPTVSQLLRLVFPYLMAAPRDALSELCRACLSALDPVAVPVPLWDASAKLVVLFAAAETRELTRTKFVVDRRDVMASTTAALCTVERTWTWLFPYFASPVGEKFVLEQRVEAGEGRGPLKEWVALLSTAWATPFTQLPVTTAAISVAGRRVEGEGVAIGVQLGWHVLLDGTEYTVVGIEPGAVSIDPPWPSAAMVVDAVWRAPRTPLFVYVQASESHWLNEHTVPGAESCDALGLVGFVLAMALLHQTPLALRLHPAVFRCLLYEAAPDRTLFEAVDPSLAAAWATLGGLADFSALLKLEGLPPETTVDAYVGQLVQDKAAAVEWQLNELRRGFYHAIPAAFSVCGFTGAELHELLCGPPASDNFDLRDVFKVVEDDALVGCRPMHDAFWRVVDEFSATEKRALIKFVTGIDKLPLPQTEILRLDMPWPVATSHEKKLVLLRLPQAHTCENTLELPNYYGGLDASDDLPQALTVLLRTKLLYAMAHGLGYDLDVAGRPQPTHQPSADDSSESIELPSLQLNEASVEPPACTPKPATPLRHEPPRAGREDEEDYAFDDFEAQ
ncbi:hypothetical protein ACHHYP_13896 [Achlya hypogyna]|uniref:HECT-type E3 ubiquitin transferase n=1 Tax=Achlya hypogyna TaxID=1202772 RepID=A0A1V9YEH2_ACHHY|nr:hypothetical protein ACHHYP_13896 [Achlya hypogyna]